MNSLGCKTLGIMCICWGTVLKIVSLFKGQPSDYKSLRVGSSWSKNIPTMINKYVTWFLSRSMYSNDNRWDEVRITSGFGKVIFNSEFWKYESLFPASINFSLEAVG